MLTCKQFDEFMVDFLEHDLPFRQKLGCWLHLKMCRDCTQFVREYRQTIALGKQAFDDPNDPVPESVPDELIDAALAHRRNAESNG